MKNPNTILTVIHCVCLAIGILVVFGGVLALILYFLHLMSVAW